jgi:hypothetical protein
MNEDTPKIIMTICIALLFILLGAVVLNLIIDETGITSSGCETQTITDPSSDVDVDIGFDDATITRVQYEDNDGWHTVDSGNYSYSDTTVTIDHGAWS